MSSDSPLTWSFGAAVPQELSPGTVINNRFKVISTLGSGQSGFVYRVLDRQGSRFFALKHFRFRALSDLYERLRQEASITHALEHPGLVRVCDVGVYLDRPFILYQQVEGRSFHELLKDRVSVGRAEKLLKQVAEALCFAHSRGVIHRDLKPKNVLVDSLDNALISDFGLAWAPGNKQLTATGFSVGTPRFMSPEQLLGRSKGRDYKADVWSFGVMMVFALTGEYPLQSKDLARIQRGREIVLKVPSHPALTGSLARVVKGCLQIDPEQRLASAQEIIDTWL